MKLLLVGIYLSLFFFVFLLVLGNILSVFLLAFLSLFLLLKALKLVLLFPIAKLLCTEQ